MQGDGPPLTFWQAWRIHTAQQATIYVMISKIEHDYYVSRLKELKHEYLVFTGQGETISKSLAERLRTLNDLITHQFNDESKRLNLYSQEIQTLVTANHDEWREIQREINEMLEPIDH